MTNKQTDKKLRRNWWLSFYTRSIFWRYLATPLGTNVVRYYLNSEGTYVDYKDIYVFGVRIVRIHLT